MQAITAAANFLNGKYLSDCGLYIYARTLCDVHGRNLLVKLSKIFWSRGKKKDIKRLVWTHPKASVYGGIMADEAGL